MKLFLAMIFVAVTTQEVRAEARCDVRPGTSSGVRVIEFATGNVIHSKMAMNGVTAGALAEELVSLQDMGVCEETTVAQKCVLRYEKGPKANVLTLFRGSDRWASWQISVKKQAQDFIKSLKKKGFCS